MWAVTCTSGKGGGKHNTWWNSFGRDRFLNTYQWWKRHRSEKSEVNKTKEKSHSWRHRHSPRGSWLMGITLDVRADAKGLLRSVHLRTRNSIRRGQWRSSVAGNRLLVQYLFCFIWAWLGGTLCYIGKLTVETSMPLGGLMVFYWSGKVTGIFLCSVIACFWLNKHFWLT